MAIYPEQIIYEIKISGVWEDITADVISSQDCQYGIMDNGIGDRVASTGTLKFNLRNDSSCIGGIEGYYTPTIVGSKTGWKKGIHCRLKIVYNSITFIKFYGHISSIEIDPENKIVKVLVTDWMDYASTYPVLLPIIDYNKKINDVVKAIVDVMPILPLHTSYNLGQDEFNTIFDTVRDNTKAVSEFNKVALSELGYVYIKRDIIDGETLVVEGRNTRSALNTLQKIPTIGGFLQLEDGGYLLLETGGKIQLNATQEAIFDNTMEKTEVVYGDILNRINVKVYPRQVDTSDTVLFSLNSPISLSGSETKTGIRGTYNDPTARATKITAKDVLAPVSGTDYKMFSNSSGSGTNLTAYLAVSASYGAQGVEYSLTNTGATPGYVTTLQARGKGIYLYDPISYTAQSASSILENGYAEYSIDMKYQDGILSAESLADVLLSQNKDPRTVVNKISFLANLDADTMSSFLYVDIGDLIKVIDNKIGIETYFYVQGVQFKILFGGIIKFTWIVKEAISLNEQYWFLGLAGYTELGSTTILGY